jgi:hypothetical protein
MAAHRQPSGADLFQADSQDQLWTISPPARRWPLRVRLLARLQAPWLDFTLASGADPAGSPALERRAAHLLSHINRVRVVGALRQGRRSAGLRVDPGDLRIPVDPEEVRIAHDRLLELEELLISSGPVYCRGVVMASQIVGDGAGPLYAPRRRGELGERVTKVLAALRGAF